MEFVSVSGRFLNTTFEAKLKLVFDIYDVDSDGSISESDIRGILSHIPLEVIVRIVIMLDFVRNGRTS